MPIRVVIPFGASGLVALSLLFSSAATAGNRTPGTGGVTSAAPSTTIESHAEREDVSFTPGGGGGPSPCDYVAVSEDDSPDWLPAPVDEVTTTDADGRIGRLYVRYCPGQPAVLVWVDEIDPQVLLASVRDRVAAALPAPTMTLTPTDAEFGWIYVQTPTDFRVEAADWQPVSVTARAGPVWMTVTAEPETLTFDPGDPHGPPGVICDGEGPVAPYVIEVPGACSYTYRNESSTSPYDGYHFMTALTTSWAVSWVGSTGAGTLDALQTSSTQPVAVAAIKALITCTGPRPEQGGCG